MITFNEISNIERCLEAIDFASEIIVVDSYSTDGTFEYLQNRPGVRVLQRHFRNFTDQKNFALQQASCPWVLFIDADEVVTPGLRHEILDAVSRPRPGVSAYWFYRKFMFKTSPLHFSGWQTDKNIRLFRRDKARYCDSRLVHEVLRVEGKTARMKSKLLHFCYRDFQSYKNKISLYGKFKAQEAIRRGKKPAAALLLLKPLWKFTYNYIFRLGILDGLSGLTICYLDAYSYVSQYRSLRRNSIPIPQGRLATYRADKEDIRVGLPVAKAS